MKKLFECAISLLMILALLAGCGYAVGSGEPQAVVRGDTMIIRVPVDWLRAELSAGRLENNDLFGVEEPEIPLEHFNEIFNYARLYLGSGAAKFLKDCADGEAKAATGYWATAYPADFERIMAQQYADGAWYTVVRMKDGEGRDGRLFVDGSKYTLKMKKNMLLTDVPVCDSEEIFVSVEDAGGEDPEVSGSGIDVYEVFGQYLAVAKAPYRDEKTLGRASMLLNGRRLETVTNGKLAGYRDGGGNAVYCTLLTEDEVYLLPFGVGMEIVYDPFTY